MDILHRAQEIGVSVQVNTTVAKHNVDILPEMVQFIQEVNAVQWSLFFLVPTGRAQVASMISAEQHEQVFNWLYDLSQNAPFDIKSTAAPMYRRVAIQRKRAEQGADKPVTFQGAGFQYADGLNRPTRGVNDGNGFCSSRTSATSSLRAFCQSRRATPAPMTWWMFTATRRSSKTCAM
jgi:AdoMet-dependent heme synthase